MCFLTKCEGAGCVIAVTYWELMFYFAYTSIQKER